MSFLDVLLGRKHPPVIGLDISSSSVKLVELGQSSSGEFVLERFGSEPFEKGWITDGQIEKFDEVADNLLISKELWFAVPFLQLGFEIEEIEMRRSADQVNVDHTLGARLMMKATPGKEAASGPVRTGRGIAVLRQQGCQRGAAHSHADVLKQLTSRQLTGCVGAGEEISFW